jgi:hypothetical protein
MITISDDEIWFWYNLFEYKFKENLICKKLAKQYNLSITQLYNKQNAIYGKSRTNPELYKALNHLVSVQDNYNGTISKFCKDHKVSENLYTDHKGHLEYLKIIERLKSERTLEFPPKPMKVSHRQYKEKNKKISDLTSSLSKPRPVPKGLTFNPIEPNWSATLPITDGPKVTEKPDIEILASKGIRVLISHEVDATNILKIIQLIKDL